MPQLILPADLPALDASAASLRAWHTLLEAGLSSSLLQLLSAPGLFKRAPLNMLVFGKRTAPRAAQLNQEQSNYVYRVLVCLHGLTNTFANDATWAVTWMTSPCALLKGQVPLSLLSTPMGFEFVRTAASRTESPSPKN